MILKINFWNMTLGIFELFSWYQCPNIFVKFFSFLFYHMSNLFTIFWELKVNFLFCLIDLKFIVEIIFCSQIVWIVTWEYLKLSIFSENFHVILICFDLFIKTADLLSIFIDETTVDIQLINIFVLFWDSFEVECVNSFPFNISREAII